MRLSQIETFLAVAECGSFSKAGERLFISSSAVAQQIRALEDSIGAKLFIRTTHGVRLTEIGAFLAREGRALVSKGHEMEEQIHTMRYEQENCILLGTGMWQNCSLFYSLWGRFSIEHEGFQIRTVRLGDDFRLRAQGAFPDLIESVRDGESWQKEYSYLHLCYDRMVCAVSPEHPLAGCSSLSFEMMRPYQLLTAPEGLSDETDRMADEAASHGIRVRHAVRYDFPLFTECRINNWLLQIPEAWSYLLPDFQIIPCDWDFHHDYGFFYREPMNLPLKLFLEFAEQERSRL